jgi:pantoate--beta-alanine ligase
MTTDIADLPLPTVATVRALREHIAAWRAAGASIGFVPTMGALHEGHLSLVDRARQAADRVVASIFVNPTQFGPNEDLDAYPRPLARDARLLAERHCDLLFAPPVEEIYPPGFATSISVGGVTRGLCGADRPGHFDGVATVVCKLFNQVTPDIAVFGEKDYQQLLTLKRLVRDLDMPVEIIGAPIVREASGLALSSRNQYLSADQHRIAAALSQTLREVAEQLARGADIASQCAAGAAALLAAGFQSVDYLELRDADTLEPVGALARPARLLAAARLGTTRLIDNWPVLPPDPQ